MGSHPIQLLASDDVPVKLIGIVVVLIIWGIGAMASAMGKARTEAQRRRSAGFNPAQPPRLPVGAAPPFSPRPAAPLPPLPTVTRPPLPRQSVAPVSTQSAPPVPRPSIASPALTGLLRPKTLRAQFILAEVLQPPLALRAKRMF